MLFLFLKDIIGHIYFLQNVAHWEVSSRASEGILSWAHAVVVLAQVVRNVERWNGAPREELLRHAWSINFVNNDIEAVDLRKRIHLELASPFCGLPDPVDVVLDSLVILHEKFVELFVLFNVFGAVRPKLRMKVFRAPQLVR